MKTKKEFKWFTTFQYEEEQEYLRAMHKAGWNFRRVSGLGRYSFEECAPEDVIYQLDYNREGLEHKAEYVQLFADCGWEYLQDFFGYSYFRKPAAGSNGDASIFCDDESRLQMMERLYKGRLLPLLILFCCCLLPQFINNVFVYHNYFLGVLLGMALGIYVGIFVDFAVKYMRYKNRLKK